MLQGPAATFRSKLLFGLSIVHCFCSNLSVNEPAGFFSVLDAHVTIVPHETIDYFLYRLLSFLSGIGKWMFAKVLQHAEYVYDKRFGTKCPIVDLISFSCSNFDQNTFVRAH